MVEGHLHGGQRKVLGRGEGRGGVRCEGGGEGGKVIKDNANEMWIYPFRGPDKISDQWDS